MTPTPEDALDRHLPVPPLTTKPISFLEWASAGISVAALLAEMIRRIFPSVQDGSGFLVIHVIIGIAVGLVCIQGIPILVQELTSKRRGTADYYMVSLEWHSVKPKYVK